MKIWKTLSEKTKSENKKTNKFGTFIYFGMIVNIFYGTNATAATRRNSNRTQNLLRVDLNTIGFLRQIRK